MKFRNTFSSVIISLLIVILSIGFAYFNGRFNIGDSFLEDKLQEINLPEGFSFSCSSLERTFLKEIVLYDFFLYYDDTEIFSAKEIKTGFSIIQYLKKNAKLSISATDFETNITQNIINDIQKNIGVNDSNEPFPFNLEAIQLINGKAVIDFNDLKLISDIPQGKIAFNKKFDITQFLINLQNLEINYKENDIKINELALNMDANKLLKFEIQNAKLEKIVNINNVSGSVNISDIKKISGKVNIDNGTSLYNNFEGNFNSLDLNFIYNWENSISMICDFNDLIFKTNDMSFDINKSSIKVESNFDGDTTYEIKILESFAKKTDYGNINLDNLIVTGNGNWKKLNISAKTIIGKITSDIPVYDLTNLESTNFEANLNYLQNNFKLDFYTPLLGNYNNNLINDFSSNITGNFVLTNNEINEFNVIFDKIKIDSISNPIKADLSYDTTKILKLDINLEDSLVLKAEADPKTKSGTCRIAFNDFQITSFDDGLSKLIPTITSIYDNETRIEGNIFITGNIEEELFGKANAQIALRNIILNDTKQNFATTFDGKLSYPQLTVNQITLTSGNITAEYSGTVDLANLLPQGRVALNKNEDGKLLSELNFEKNYDKKSFSYNIFSPIFPQSTIYGDFYPENLNNIKSSFILTSVDKKYDGSFVLDLLNPKLDLNFNGMELSAILDEDQTIDATLNFNQFEIEFEKLSKIYLEGKLEAFYNTIDGNYSVNLTNFYSQYGSYGRLGLDLKWTPSNFDITNIQYKGLNGNINLNYNNLTDLVSQNFDSVVLKGKLAGNPGNIEFYAYKNAVKIDIQNFDTSIIPSLNLKGNISLQAFGNIKGNMFGDVSGTIQNIDFKSFFKLNKDSINLIDADASYNTTKLEAFNFSYSFDSKTVVTDFRINNIMNNHIGVQYQKGDISFSGQLGEDFKEITGKLKNENCYLTSEFPISSGTHDITVNTKEFEINGDYINGSYSFDTKTIDLNIDKSFIFGLNVSGKLDKMVNLSITDVYFPLPILNQLINFPEFQINDGKLRGDLQILGEIQNPEFFGTLFVNRFDIKLFWFPDQNILINNLTLTLDQNTFTSNRTEITIKNDRTGVISYGTNDNTVKFENWQFQEFTFGMNINDPVSFWFPMPEMDFNVETSITGSVEYYGGLDTQGTRGNIVISNGVIDFDVPTLPYWVSTDLPAIDLDLQIETGKDVSFYFPKESNPILNMTFSQGEKIRLVNGIEDGLTVDGNLSFKSGKIYYFQKDFFITSGNLRFDPKVKVNEDEIPIVLDMTARIRDFDNEGNRIDINLILEDASLNNISPRFESTPALSESEILTLLGQNILPDSIYANTSVSSFASLAVATTEAISKLGIIDTETVFSIDQTIREALNLDSFSVRTNILQNLLFDALPGSFLNNQLSPLAKYLDGTTVFVGKDLGSGFFLQGTLQFTGNNFLSDKEGNTFLADDLLLNVEMSLDWENQLGNFQIFSQPNELSVFNIFDNIGFSVTKTIKF